MSQQREDGAVMDGNGDKLKSTLYMFRGLCILLIFAAVVYGFIALSPGAADARRQALSPKGMLVPAILVLMAYTHLWTLARKVYSTARAVGIIALALLTPAFPVVCFLVHRKATQCLREPHCHK